MVKEFEMDRNTLLCLKWITSKDPLVALSATLRTMACQAPLFVGFSGQEYWSGLPFPPPVNQLYSNSRL